MNIVCNICNKLNEAYSHCSTDYVEFFFRKSPCKHYHYNVDSIYRKYISIIPSNKTISKYKIKQITYNLDSNDVYYLEKNNTEFNMILKYIPNVFDIKHFLNKYLNLKLF